jgi:hypothetical protein
MNFWTLYTPKDLQVDHKIVIAYELKPHDCREEKNDPLSSSKLSFMPKHYYISLLFMVAYLVLRWIFYLLA